MTQKSEFGKEGEDIAAEYLIKQGFKIIDRNYRKPWGEIDIICQAPDKTLVFVEVKTVRQYGDSSAMPDDRQANNPQLMAEDQLTKSKLARLIRTASLYSGQNEKLIIENKGWRIDLIALTFNNERVDIKHYENI